MSKSLSILGFTQKELDEAVRLTPKLKTRLLTDPMWREKNLTTTSVIVEFTDGKIALIPNRSRHDAPNLKAWEYGSKQRSFVVPHLPLETTIEAPQIQDVRKIGTKDSLLSNAEVIADEIAEHRSYHDATLEHLMLGAVKGKILDADGKTVLYDLYQEFNLTENIVDLKTTAKSADLGLQIEQAARTMKQRLHGDTATGITVLCSAEFFDNLVSHESTKEAFARYQENVLAREGTAGKFVYRGVSFEIYDTLINGESAIEAGHAYGFLSGTRNTFRLYYAPANMLKEANTLAHPFYASVDVTGHNRIVSLYTESNPLPMCVRPQTLVHFKF